MNLDDRDFLAGVGARIRAAREGRNLTQAALGELCGLHRTFVGSVERGTRNVSLLNLRKIAAALRTPPAKLLE